VLQLLKGGAAPGVLMPTVHDLAVLLATEGLKGLRILMDPSSFKTIPPEVCMYRRRSS
jgi:hypothetical protein